MTMRFVSYNVKSGLESDLETVGRVLAPLDADVVGLQEVDRGTRRSGARDQATELAALAGLEHAAFAPATPWEGGGEYGVALLSRHEVSDVRLHRLYVPGDPSVPASLREPRVLLSATVTPEGEPPVRVFVTHFGLHPDQRRIQAHECAAAAQQASVWGPVVLLGDLNAEADADELRPLLEPLRPAHEGLPEDERRSFPAGARPGQGVLIDFVLIPPEARVVRAEVLRGGDPASDHDPLIADVAFG